VASVQELLRGPARATLSNTESRFRLGDLVEALDRELPAVADLAVRRAIDLEVDQDIITPGLLIASAFPPAPAQGAAVPSPAGSTPAGRQGRAVHPCQPHQGLERDAA
jgi:hypothetical protein